MFVGMMATYLFFEASFDSPAVISPTDHGAKTTVRRRGRLLDAPGPSSSIGARNIGVAASNSSSSSSSSSSSRGDAVRRNRSLGGEGRGGRAAEVAGGDKTTGGYRGGSEHAKPFEWPDVPTRKDVQEWTGFVNFVNPNHTANFTTDYGGVTAAARDTITTADLVGLLTALRGTLSQLSAALSVLPFAEKMGDNPADASSFEAAVDMFLDHVGGGMNSEPEGRAEIVASEDVALSRRLIYATFVLEAQRLPEDAGSSVRVQSALDKLATALVAMHHRRIAVLQTRNPVPDYHGKTAALHFLHISKSGGTTMCAGFKKYCGPNQLPSNANNEKLPHCWVRGTGPIWEAPRKHRNLKCEELGALYADKSASVVSNEGHLMGGTADTPLTSLCNSAFLHATLLRNPFSRTMSHSTLDDVHISASAESEMAKRELGDCHWGKSEKNGKADCRYSEFTLQQRMAAQPAIFNNYIHRVLLGPNVYHSAHDGVKQHHLLLAQQQLARFDTVVVLEDKRGMEELLQKTLLVPTFDLDTVMKRHRKPSSVAKTARHTTQKEWGMVRNNNLLDFHVWRFGWLIHKLDYQIFKRGGGGGGRAGGFAGSQRRSTGGNLSVCGDAGIVAYDSELVL